MSERQKKLKSRRHEWFEDKASAEQSTSAGLLLPSKRARVEETSTPTIIVDYNVPSVSFIEDVCKKAGSSKMHANLVP